jgi:hypothetical protein
MDLMVLNRVEVLRGMRGEFVPEAQQKWSQGWRQFLSEVVDYRGCRLDFRVLGAGIVNSPVKSAGKTF